MADAFTSVTEFDAVAASSQLRVFLGKKISDGIALVILQFNSILMLYFCNLSSLMKKSLPWLMLLLQQLSLTLLLRLRSLSMKNSSQCAFYIVACCAFAIFLHRWKKLAGGWYAFVILNSELHWLGLLLCSIWFNDQTVRLGNFSLLAMLICDNARRSRGFERKYHLLRKLLDSSCTEMLNLDWKDRLRYQDPVVEFFQLKKQSRCSVPFWGVQAWSTSNVLPSLGVA